MVDQRPFLLETLAQVDNNTFPFQQHFKMICDLLLPPTRVCCPPFKQFIEQQMVWFQDSISAPSYPFQHCFQQNLNPSCLNFIMLWPKGKCLAYNLTNFPNLLINFPNLFHNILNMTSTTHPSMHVHTSHQLYGYPPFTLCPWQ